MDTTITERQLKNKLWRDIKRHRAIYALLLIPVAYFIVFKYIPIWNGQIAFKRFMPRQGVLGSEWIGFANFREFFNSFYFWELLRNTVMYSVGKLLISVPLSIVLAITLYECRVTVLRKTVQTLTYLPHFLSWVIMYGILLVLLAPGDGLLNDIIKAFGGKGIDFLTNVKAFPWVVLLSDAWKEMGWGAIIFIAALMAIDPTLFEAAMVEGASSWQRVRYITLPSIRPVIIMVVLLRLGTILSGGFNQLYMLYSPSVYSVGDIIDTWVFRGLQEGKFALATAVGLFKGMMGLILVIISNRSTKKISGSSLY
ncbi:MAG: ABC transporter permease subunit [Sphaerochaetaceae bacterium]|jgi:putative aldouronate transport system permease protein|nr:ABC transporter permease subunit [Sphaerochaetaceae bacterium]NLO60568.1 sugar ABC transporter permease [Spirochaetales bacterium]MDD2405660.1 ABC transporter permease subunit [Sphaerochaetaceae bacterium]MDD3670453.1 ABC transporter permease subunit [Sphaerochaetaceae bacterium]MDD4258402.1 ABC transporter permease subunit [Sphaerochaetaceae bacterium]